MSDGLEYLRGSFGSADNIVSMTFNEELGLPWHRMGQPGKGARTLTEILVDAHCDREVTMEPVIAKLPNGTELVVPNKRAAVLKGKTLTIPDPEQGITTLTVPDKVVGVHSDGFRPHQFRDVAMIAEIALGLYSADPVLVEQFGENVAAWDTCGLLNDGAFFFANLVLPDGIIDPNGIADKCKRRFYVRTANDGTQATEGGGKAQREVCWNTVTAGRRSAMFKIKHTSKSEERIQQAIKAVQTEKEWWASFTTQAHDLLAISDEDGRVMDKVMKQFVPLPDELGRGLTLAENKRNDLYDLYLSDTNSGTQGRNGWTIYNTFAEFSDWHLPVRGAGTDTAARVALRVEQQILGTQDAAKNKIADFLLTACR